MRLLICCRRWVASKISLISEKFEQEADCFVMLLDEILLFKFFSQLFDLVVYLT